MNEEKWEWYNDLENRYKISSLGRLISYCKSKKGKIRKSVLALGYPQVQLWINNRMESRKIHRIVAETFIPNPENKPEVNHINGIKTDNRVENLEWCTASENRLHSYRVLGKKSNLENQKGESHYNAKYKKEDILKMREMYDSGKYNTTEIGKLYNDRAKNILRIVKRERWKNI